MLQIFFSGTVSVPAWPERLALFLWPPFSSLCSCPRQWPRDASPGSEHGDLPGNAFYEGPDGLANVSSWDCYRATSRIWVTSAAAVKSSCSQKGKKSGEGNGRIPSWRQSYLSGIVNVLRWFFCSSPLLTLLLRSNLRSETDALFQNRCFFQATGLQF